MPRSDRSASGAAPFQVGDPIAVDLFPGRVVTHVGIVSAVGPQGDPGAQPAGGAVGVLVISASARRRGVFEEPLDHFAHGGAPYHPGYACLLPRAEVVARARSLLGRPYRLLTDNCEHLVMYCLGHEPKSPQLRRFARRAATVAGAMVAVVGTVATTFGRYRRPRA